MPRAVRGSVTISAVPEQVRAAREFVGRVLWVSYPCADDALLLVSELVTNSIVHGGSAAAGGEVTATVAATRNGVRVEVAECSGDGVPVLLPAADSERERSRGMRLVDDLAARWG